MPSTPASAVAGIGGSGAAGRGRVTPARDSAALKRPRSARPPAAATAADAVTAAVRPRKARREPTPPRVSGAGGRAPSPAPSARGAAAGVGTSSRRASAPATAAATLGTAATAVAFGVPSEASTPSRPNAAMPIGPARGRRRATIPRTAPNTADSARMPMTSTCLSLLPNVSMAKRSTGRGARSMTSVATASIGDRSRESSPATSSPVPSARAAAATPATAAASRPGRRSVRSADRSPRAGGRGPGAAVVGGAAAGGADEAGRGSEARAISPSIRHRAATRMSEARSAGQARASVPVPTMAPVGCGEPVAGSSLIATIVVDGGSATRTSSSVPVPSTPSETGWGPSSDHSW